MSAESINVTTAGDKLAKGLWAVSRVTQPLATALTEAAQAGAAFTHALGDSALEDRLAAASLALREALDAAAATYEDVSTLCLDYEAAVREARAAQDRNR